MRGCRNCYMQMRLWWIDGMVIIGHRFSESTVGANKAINMQPIGRNDIHHLIKPIHPWPASGCSWVLKGFSKFMLAGKDVCGWSNISAFVQELKKSRYWMFTESPHHLFMITHSTLRDILTFLIFVFDISKSQIHTHPPGLLPKSRSDTHPRTLSVKSIRLCICAIGIKITPRNWSPNGSA